MSYNHITTHAVGQSARYALTLPLMRGVSAIIRKIQVDRNQQIDIKLKLSVGSLKAAQDCSR